ncbi:gas vesicle protein [Streptomyces camponoticapitis]|uniref:Gas vesicle protein n=2 Tax=Streptomyces camponoticapitis TaxID=1616125 RepID=A0ABQ2E431_9ACTN|nr:gas vesicle protein [Streptomyces camponoticapitis]
MADRRLRQGVPDDPRRAENMATTESTDSKNGNSAGGGQERIDVATAMRKAAGQLAGLLQCEPSSVSSLKATDDGWTADVEVVEIEKIPDTTSVMASYRVSLDGQGQLLGYERIRRYSRGQVDH